MNFNFRGLLLSLLLLGLLLALIVQAGKPPRPKGLDAPPEQFSAARAFETLKYLLGDETPHPAGSEANARVRDRIVEKLKSLGYEPQTVRGEMNQENSPGKTVENIHCFIPGKTEGSAVMLAAHFDSAPAGPGAADDGAGVATILEIARILKRETPLRNPIVLLITDSEETGLWGARTFVWTNPLAKKVAAVVNLEARGTSGRSLMFETGVENAWLISLYAAAATSPDTSSFYNDVYRRMPNSTDFTIFKQEGMTGFNFAFIGNKGNYHTAGDNLANLDHGSLQHHGDNALAIIRSLAAVDLSNTPRGKAVYTDILSLFVIRWPEGWTVPLTVLAILPLAIVIFALLRKKTLSPRTLLSGFALLPVIVVLPVLLGIVTIWPLRLLPVSPQFWSDHALCTRLMLWSETLVAVIFLTIHCTRWSGGWGLWAGTWIWWSILGLAVAILLPSASYFFLLPLGTAAIAALSFSMFRLKKQYLVFQTAFALVAICTGIIWLKMPLAIEDVFGFRFPSFITAPLSMALLTFAPLWLVDTKKISENPIVGTRDLNPLQPSS